MIDWVATHRRHHKFSDKEGDPHSPWRFGPGFEAADQGPALGAHGLAVRRPTRTNREKYAPDLVKRPGHHQAAQALPRAGVASLLLPAAPRRPAHLVLAGRADRPSSGARLVRDRACCTTSPGRSTRSATSSARRPSRSRDKSRNVWWLAIPSFGESWHNLHHCRPDLRPARRAQGPDRPQRRRDPLVREARLGLRRPLAESRAAGGEARSARRRSSIDAGRWTSESTGEAPPMMESVTESPDPAGA